MSRLTLIALLAIFAASASSSCSRREKLHGTSLATAAPSVNPAPAASQDEPKAPPRGMVWINPGPLVVGTPPNAFPRRPDRELAGEQFVLHGFYIDIFPYPNEEGAIPATNINQIEARATCSKLGKRLCTELEWEHACKGPSQYTYEYGERYREDTCGTGAPVIPRPSGIKVGCQSDFHVHDLHGGVFEWTDSRWARGMGNANKVAIRGGNDGAGEVVGRCANAEPRAPETRSSSIGLRCCLGPVNEMEVVMRVEHGQAVTMNPSPDAGLLHRMLEHLPSDAQAELGDNKWNAIWGFVWRPIGNERLVALSMCAQTRVPQSCAVLVGRDTPGLPTVLGAAGTGFFPSKLYVDESARDVWLLGTDASGPFRRLLRYSWGHVDVGPRERQSALPDNKKSSKKHKRESHAL